MSSDIGSLGNRKSETLKVQTNKPIRNGTRYNKRTLLNNTIVNFALFLYCWTSNDLLGLGLPTFYELKEKKIMLLLEATHVVCRRQWNLLLFIRFTEYRIK